MDGEDVRAAATLVRLAKAKAAGYAALPQTRAILLAGSTAEGQSDYFSDIDMSVYYNELPTEEELNTVRVLNHGSESIWRADDPNGGSFAEAYLVDGVECQVAHATISAWERDMDSVLNDLDVTSPLQKALEGLLHGMPLYGDALILPWKDRAEHYPDTLAVAMVKHHLSFFPIWYLQERLSARDAVLWCHQIMVENEQHILGILAGLNKLYYSTFQFKRMRRFIGQMHTTPPNLADRLERILTIDLREAIDELEGLVVDTVWLVEEHMPSVDTTSARKRLGKRQQPWKPV